MEDDFRRLLAGEFAPYERLSERQLEILESHYSLLCKWNKRINLCRFTNIKEAIQLHYCEGLYLGRFLPAGPLRIADVGSGAGFPGFIIAALRSDCRVDLIESDQRKAAFLRESCGDLPNLRVIADRAENVDAQYDWVVSRAVRAEVVRSLRLAPNFALLTTELSTIRVPWGERRFIDTFHVEQ